MRYQPECVLTVSGSNALVEYSLFITDDVLREADKLARASASGKGYEPAITRELLEIAIRKVTRL